MYLQIQACVTTILPGSPQDQMSYLEQNADQKDDKELEARMGFRQALHLLCKMDEQGTYTIET